MPNLLIRLRNKQALLCLLCVVQYVSTRTYIVSNCCFQENKELYLSQYYGIY